MLNAFAGCKVWVHCAKNMRVSAFIYLYRKLVLGEGEEQAYFPMREVWSPNGIWQAFIGQICLAHSDTPAAGGTAPAGRRPGSTGGPQGDVNGID